MVQTRPFHGIGSDPQGLVGPVPASSPAFQLTTTVVTPSAIRVIYQEHDDGMIVVMVVIVMPQLAVGASSPELDEEVEGVCDQGAGE